MKDFAAPLLPLLKARKQSVKPLMSILDVKGQVASCCMLVMSYYWHIKALHCLSTLHILSLCCTEMVSVLSWHVPQQFDEGFRIIQ